MKLAVFNAYRIGVVDGEQVYDITQVLPEPLRDWRYGHMNWLIAHWSSMLPAIHAARAAAQPQALASVNLHAPVPNAPHVFAAPANYRKHINELGVRSVSKGRSAREQGFFLKAPGSVVGPHSKIVLPRGSQRRFDHESELAVIIGRAGRDIPRAQAMDYVFGYACLMDLTMRIEPGVAEEERSMRKSFASFTPVGPFLVTADEVPHPDALQNRLWVNGELRQDANTRDMIVDIPEMIELVSSVLALSPGDIIASGTPEGVGPMLPGDVVTIEIEQVGRMSLHVIEAAQVAPRAF